MLQVLGYLKPHIIPTCHNNPKFLDRYVSANSADPDQTELFHLHHFEISQHGRTSF